MTGLLDGDSLETSIRQNVEEISALIGEYDEQDQISGVEPFSSENRLRNLIRGLAAKSRSNENLSEAEGIQKAEKLVHNIEQELRKPTVKQRLCALADGSTGDALSLVPFMLELAKAGLIAVPFDPSGASLLTVGALFVARLGIKAYCSA